MIQRCHRPGFALKSSEAVRVACHLRGQDLQRHITAELRIGRAIDVTHAARADFPDDAVVRYILSCVKGRFSRHVRLMLWSRRKTSQRRAVGVKWAAYHESIDTCRRGGGSHGKEKCFDGGEVGADRWLFAGGEER